MSLRYAVPFFLRRAARPMENASIPYTKAAEHVAGCWFKANPVHCLRSKYLHKHNPPCVFSVRGKEHVIQTNPSIKVFFEPPPPPKPAKKDVQMPAMEKSGKWSMFGFA